MSAIGQAIRKLREEHGWTQAQLGAQVGLDGTNIARRESGRTRVKASERVAFAQAFGLSLLEFDEQWRQWSIPRTRGAPGIPIINRAPAGEVVNYEEYGVDSGQGFEYVDFGQITEHPVFGVVVVGDSMAPTLYEGDYLILAPTDPYRADGKLTDGKIVFIRFTVEYREGGCTLARFFDAGQGQIRLHKDNPQYAPILCDRAYIQSVAVAIERRSRL